MSPPSYLHQLPAGAGDSWDRPRACLGLTLHVLLCMLLDVRLRSRQLSG